ncbi:MAG: hypothetical protein K6C36_00290, partial [Clostridia bacterium]|nr:hypothetical protein [Clostridia bacterium]
MKRFSKIAVSLCLALLMLFELGGASLQYLPELKGLFTLTAAAVPTPMSGKDDTFDLNQALNDLKAEKTVKPGSDEEIRWVEVSTRGGLKSALESTDPACAYVKVVANIDETVDHGSSGRDGAFSDKNTKTVGKMKLWKECIVVQTNKVLDLNGYSVNVNLKNYKENVNYDEKTKDAEGNETYNAPTVWYAGNLSLFCVTGNETTMLLLDSSKQETGKLSFSGYMWGSGKHYRKYIVRDLFQVINGATVYALSGTYQAGRSRLQDVYSGWQKFKGIGGAVLKGALGIASAAANIYTSFTTGGLSETISSGVSGMMSTISNLDTNEMLGLVCDLDKKVSTPAKIQQPSGETAEGDADDMDGKSADAKNPKDVEAQQGAGASVAGDGLGIFVTTVDTTPIYKDENRVKIADLKKGDEIQVVKLLDPIIDPENPSNTREYYLVKYKDVTGYVTKGNIKYRATLTDAELAALPTEGVNIIHNGVNESAGAQTKSTLEKLTESFNATTGALAGPVSDVKKAVTAITEIAKAVEKYSEKYYQIHWGTVFKTRSDDARVIIFDGTYIGFGQDDDIRDSVIDLSEGGEVYVLGGNFMGMAGANIFALKEDAPENLTIRAGEFTCTSLNKMRGIYVKDDDKHTILAGVRGYVNAPIECFGRNMVKDGRIQIRETTGVGNLVVKDKSIEGNKIVYKLYCDEADLPNISNMSVYPREGGSSYLQYALKLVGKAEHDADLEDQPENIISGDRYMDFTIGDTAMEWDYLAPLVPDVDLSSSDTKDAIEKALDKADVFYYKYPKSSFLSSLRGNYIPELISTGAAADASALQEIRTYNYITNLRTYTYTLYEIDPVTQQNIGEPVAKETVPSSEILTGQIYLSPYKTASNGNNRYLYDGWEAGKLYRVTLTVDEYIEMGLPRKYMEDEFGGTVKMDTCGSSSLIIRCLDVNDNDQFTPAHFTEENVGVGDTVECDFINAQVGRIDIYGEKLFSVTYDWRVVEYPDLHLVYTDRTKDRENHFRKEYNASYTPGKTYDQYWLEFDKTDGGHSKNELGTVKDGVFSNVAPERTGSDTIVIPKQVTYNAGGREVTVDLANKHLYCEVSYGLNYYRWARALKFLPVCDGQDARISQDGRLTKEDCTVRTKAIEILPTATNALTKEQKGNGNTVKQVVEIGTPFYMDAWTTFDWSSGFLKEKLRDFGDMCKKASNYDSKSYMSGFYYYYMNGAMAHDYTISWYTKGDTEERDEIWTEYMEKLGDKDAYYPIAEVEFQWQCWNARSRTWEDLRLSDYPTACGNGLKVPAVNRNMHLRCKLNVNVKTYHKGEAVTSFKVGTGRYKRSIPAQFTYGDIYSEKLISLVPVDARWVGGTLVNKENGANGIVQTDGWEYDYSNKTLYLHDANLETSYWKYNTDALIRFSDDLTIELSGDSTIDYTLSDRNFGEFTDLAASVIKAPKITVTGDGTLTINITQMISMYSLFPVEHTFDYSFFDAELVKLNGNGKIICNMIYDIYEPQLGVKQRPGTAGAEQFIKRRDPVEDDTYKYLVSDVTFFKTPILQYNSGWVECSTTHLPDYAGASRALYPAADVRLVKSDTGKVEIRTDGGEYSILELYTGNSRADSRRVASVNDDELVKAAFASFSERYKELNLTDHVHEWVNPEVVTEPTADSYGVIKYTCADRYCGLSGWFNTPSLGVMNLRADANVGVEGVCDDRIMLDWEDADCDYYLIQRLDPETGEYVDVGRTGDDSGSGASAVVSRNVRRTKDGTDALRLAGDAFVSYYDDEVEQGNTYTYRVTACRKGADGSEIIGGSAEATVFLGDDPGDEEPEEHVCADNAVTSGAVDATCTEPGFTGTTVCSVCGSIIDAGTDVPALGHIWDEGTVTVTPDCVTPGKKTFKCTREGCGETTTVDLPCDLENHVGTPVKAEPRAAT